MRELEVSHQEVDMKSMNINNVFKEESIYYNNWFQDTLRSDLFSLCLFE